MSTPPKEYLKAHELAFMLKFVEQQTVSPVPSLLEGGILEPSGSGTFRLTEKGMAHIRKVLRTPVTKV